MSFWCQHLHKNIFYTKHVVKQLVAIELANFIFGGHLDFISTLKNSKVNHSQVANLINILRS